MAEARDPKSELERLRRWSHAPTELSPEEAATAVRQRIASRRRAGSPWSWLAAAVVVLGLAGLWTFRPHDPDLPTADLPPDPPAVSSEALVIVPLASGTTLYIAPRYEGEENEESPQ